MCREQISEDGKLKERSKMHSNYLENLVTG